VTAPGAGRPNEFLWTPLRHRLRWVLAGSAVVSAGVHVPVVSDHLREAPYMGWEFVVLIAACLCIAVGALVCDSGALYAAAVFTCSTAVLGYAATRSVAFPRLADDVGNWFEPLGVASILAESVVVITAVVALARRSPRDG
jgi:hypothetical protein